MTRQVRDVRRHVGEVLLYALWLSLLVPIGTTMSRGRGDLTSRVCAKFFGGKRAKRVNCSRFPPIAIPRYEWVSMKVNLYPTWFQTHESIKELKRKVDMMTSDDTKLFIVEPCSIEERVSMWASKGEADFVYMYDDVFKELNIQFPFSDFECEMLSLMNATLVQLYPNS